MSDAPAAAHKQCAPDEIESAKRRQIIEGARAVFLTRGFDAASMGEIAREAGVSKGTLYVYFDSKESLFEAIITEECRYQAEQVFVLDPDDHDVEAVLVRVGRQFVRNLCRLDRMSSLRRVIGVADRMPELGKRFYAMGPVVGIGRIERYLDAQVKAGILAIDDCELAAGQFLDSCLTGTFKPLLFCYAGPPSDEKIEEVVKTAVRLLLAAYQVKQA